MSSYIWWFYWTHKLSWNCWASSNYEVNQCKIQAVSGQLSQRSKSITANLRLFPAFSGSWHCRDKFWAVCIDWQLFKQIFWYYFKCIDIPEHLFGSCHDPSSFARDTYGFLWSLGPVGFMWTQAQTWRSLPALWLSPALLPCHSWLLLSQLGFPVCGDWEWTMDCDIYRAQINQRKESYPFTGEKAFTEWNILLLLHLLIMFPLNLFLLTPLLTWNITLWFCQDSLCEMNLTYWSTSARLWVITGVSPVLSFHCSHHYVHRSP